jgi:predicted glutamine amidotransferase
MCQLTFLHGDSDFVRPLLASLTLLNAQDNNRDGHGYFILPDHLWKIPKSGSEVVCDDSYYDKLEEAIGDRKQVSIISHVRSASFNHKEICIDNTHPFVIGHLVLAHNGTLTADDKSKELELENKIDSFWFLSHLATLVGKANLKPFHIVDAMKSFNGKFAFLIFDTRQPTKVFIVKGKSAKLHHTVVKDGAGNVVVHLINTDDDNITKSILPHWYRAITKQTMVIEKPESFDDESIWVFDTKSGTLTKCEEKIIETSVPATTHEYSRGGRVWDSGDDDDMMSGYGFGQRFVHSNPSTLTDTKAKLVDDICMAAFEMNISIYELNHICELFTGDSFLYLEGKDLEEFHKFFTSRMKALFANQRGSSKRAIWELIKKKWRETYPDTIELLEIYANANIRFPWFTESKSGLKHVPIGIKTGKIHRKPASAEA